MPLDNDVSGWIVNQEQNRPAGARAITAKSYQEAVNLIDGGADPFYKAPFAPTQFLWQNYLNPSLEVGAPNGAGLMLFILQMPSAEQASGLYADLLKTPGTDYTRLTGTDRDWQDPTTPAVGTDSRIQDTGAQWWVNFYKDTYYVEVMLSPSFGPAPDYEPSDPNLKAEVLRFAEAVASRM